MLVDYIYTIDRLFTTLFIGFGLFIIFSTVFKLFIGNELKKRIDNAQLYSFILIKYVGLVLLLYLIVTWAYIISAGLYPIERATGPYKWAYYIMSLQPLVLALLAQLFRRIKIRVARWKLLMLSVIILVIAICSGQNIERFTIIVISLHRDYLPVDYEQDVFTEGILTIPLLLIWYFLKSTLIFTGILLVYWFFKNRRNDRIYTA